MITLNVLQELCPGTKPIILQSFVDPLNLVSDQAQLTGHKNRVAAFLAQVSYESGYFNFIQENLNYSAQGLVQTFNNYFPNLATAQPYAHNPQKIANKVYANRMGNGNEASGDGWTYRGRGLIQLTGKWIYGKFATSIGKSLDDTVKYLETNEGATVVAGWFWTFNKLNTYVDSNDFVDLTRHINGGTNGLADREHQYAIALKALG
jgi:putative chitinase